MLSPIVDMGRYGRALVVAMLKPAQDAGNVAQTAGALLATLIGPLAVTVLAEQTKATIERWTGLYEWLIPWVAFVATFVVVGGFLAWRAKDKKIRELEAERIPSVRTEFSQPEEGQWRLLITNNSARQIENCEVLLLSLTEIGTDRTRAIRQAFANASDGSFRFPVPPEGHAAVLLFGRHPMERRWSVGGSRTHNIDAMATIDDGGAIRLDIAIQATNLKRQELQFTHGAD